MRLDSDSLSVLYDLSTFFYASPNSDEIPIEEETSQHKKRIENYSKMMMLEKEGVIEETVQEFALSVHRLHIFPVEMKISIGRNQFFLPILCVPIYASY